ncbi:MAG: class I adenylate-forming enzyme family protein [Pseudomonadota bacterium]|nr:class I adenylate-forming enzyme family protein [Pseudomonadota bacterium]
MYVTPETRIAEYEAKGWWSGITVDALLLQTMAGTHAPLAVIDPPNREALDGKAPQRVDWAELDERVDRLAAALHDHGLRKDDRIVSQLPNTMDAVVTFLAAARLGLILSPVVMQYRQHELTHVFGKVEPAAFLTVPRLQDHDQAALAAKICADHNVKLMLFGTVDSAMAPGAIALDEAMRHADRAALARYRSDNPVQAGEVLTVCWTSGTENQPKGVPRNHNHWVLNGDVMVEATAMQSGDTVLNPFPLVNIGSIGGLVMPWLRCGGTLVLHHPFDVATFLTQLQQEKVSYTIAPPAVLGALLKQPDLLAKFDLSALRTVGSGSAPLSPWLIEGWRDRYGIEIANIFGSNEGASLFSNQHSVPDAAERARFFPRFGAEGADWEGRTAQIMKSRLVNLETEEEITEPGSVGELRLGGAMVFDGYWRAPELNQSAFDSEGYYRTGDLFEIAGPGNRFYQFQGRSKEIIMRGGVNISPAELDDLMVGLPQIREAATVGVPDDRLGERIAVAVVPHEGESPSLTDVTAWLEEREVAIFKRPEFLVTVDALPRNAMNKVVRDELRAIVLAKL